MPSWGSLSSNIERSIIFNFASWPATRKLRLWCYGNYVSTRSRGACRSLVAIASVAVVVSGAAVACSLKGVPTYPCYSDTTASNSISGNVAISVRGVSVSGDVSGNVDFAGLSSGIGFSCASTDDGLFFRANVDAAHGESIAVSFSGLAQGVPTPIQAKVCSCASDHPYLAPFG